MEACPSDWPRLAYCVQHAARHAPEVFRARQRKLHGGLPQVGCRLPADLLAALGAVHRRCVLIYSDLTYQTGSAGRPETRICLLGTGLLAHAG